MKFLLRIVSVLIIVLFFTADGYAEGLPNSLVLKTPFRIWTINPNKMDFQSEYEKMYFGDFEVNTDEEDSLFIEGLLETKPVEGIDLKKITAYLEKVIAPELEREKSDVTIDMNEEGKVTFDGYGLYGRKLDIEKTAGMIKYALEHNIEYVHLPFIREEPIVNVLSEDLKTMGIIELFSSGETDFSGSPANRIVNINTGLSKFNGHIIKPNEEFVFGDVLGEVGPETGYKQELVIKGAETIPEYGGGLCQVSTTTFRAALDAGFPILERKNHSYAVSYYTPHGLDATVYPPSPDLKFINDSPAHILMQSFTIGSKAYYNFYGTKDNRESFLIGPYYSGWKAAPPAKTVVDSKLAPGETKVVGHKVSGLDSTWYRHVVYNDETKEEKDNIYTIYSKYQARPDYYLVGPEE
ncbi:VanW family protein [Candidatus Peregrinibacteria bacterium]|nr:VanW family protein [Candidatus Peregrinibacteria bacterium]